MGPQPSTDPDRAVARLAAGSWGVVSRDELVECGLSEKAIRVRVTRGNLHPLYRGVYAVGHRNVAVEGLFLAAVKACGPLAVLSHFAAACLHQLLRWDGRPIDVTAPTYRQRPRIRAHRSNMMERVVVKGIPVTPKLRTVIDLAKHEDERTVSRALRQARFTDAELQQLPRTGLLGRIVDLPLDWPEQRLVVEVDNAEWHSDPLAQRDDAERQTELEAAGERVLRVTRAQARMRPASTLARLRAAGAPEAA